jgi:ABC-2 type transport system permease protein
MNLIFTYAKMSTKRMLRDKTAIFFVFLFPVIFLVVFGLIFKGNGGGTFSVAVFNKSGTVYAKDFVELVGKSSSLKVKKVVDEAEAQKKLSRSELDAYIVIPEPYGTLVDGNPTGELDVRYSQGNEQTAQAVTAYMQAVVGAVNQKISPYSPPFTVKSEGQNIKRVSRFDFTLGGLLGFSLMSLGIFGVINGFVGDKKTGAIGRMRVTPLKAWQLILGSALNRMLIGLMALGIMLLASALIFGFRMHGNWPSFVLVALLGSLCMFGIGLCLGGWAKNEEQAAPLANLVTFPMMFLSGVFFPTYIMPQWLQNVSHFIPLSPIVDSFRQIITEGRTVLDLGPQLAIIFAWTVVSYFVAGKVFRWE